MSKNVLLHALYVKFLQFIYNEDLIKYYLINPIYLKRSHYIYDHSVYDVSQAEKE